MAIVASALLGSAVDADEGKVTINKEKGKAVPGWVTEKNPRIKKPVNPVWDTERSPKIERLVIPGYATSSADFQHN